MKYQKQEKTTHNKAKIWNSARKQIITKEYWQLPIEAELLTVSMSAKLTITSCVTQSHYRQYENNLPCTYHLMIFIIVALQMLQDWRDLEQGRGCETLIQQCFKKAECYQAGLR